MHNENNKKTGWKPTSLDDITEIKNVLEYVRGLVIKSQIMADEYETIKSTREATRYISAKLKLNDTDELERKHIIANFKETNEYYKWLNETYNIEIVDARIAPDLQILKVLNKTLNEKDELLFNDCYNEILYYYRETFFTKAFKNQQYNILYFILTLLSMAIQRYLTKKLRYYFDIDTYTKKQLKNSFISYGFDYFDILPINYQRRLLKLLNDLIISKGTNHDLKTIIDIFGNKKIDIYKYVIAKMYPITDSGSKDYDNPYVIFYKTLADGIIDYDKDLILNYDTVTGNDILWKVDEDEILHKKKFNKQTEEFEVTEDRLFNTITSKYMSIDIVTDILKDTLKASYLFNFLYKFERDHKDKQDESDFGFFNRNMSSTKIPIFTAIVGFISLMLKKLGLEDKINFFPNQLNDIYGYNNIENNNDIKDILKEIQLLLIQNRDELEKSREYTKLYEFFKTFNMHNFTIHSGKMDLTPIYNEIKNGRSVQNQLNHGLDTWCDYVPLTQYLNDIEVDNIDKLEFLRWCLIRGKVDPKHLLPFTDLVAIFKKYVLVEGYRNPDTRGELCLAIRENKYIINDIENFLNEYKDNEIEVKAIKDYYVNGDLVNMCSEFITYNIRHRAFIIKEYSLDDEVSLSIYLRTDKKDLTYYKSLSMYINIFYLTFTEEKENEEKKFAIREFMKIFDMNEDLRIKLMDLIAKSGNYHLYRRMNKIFEIKMLTKQDTSLYKGYTYFSDYVKDNNYEFWEWITQRDKDIADGTLTGKDKKTYFREKLFELAESIDSYLGSDVFVNFPLSGILDFIIMVIYLIATVFKAFTVDLVQSDTVLRIDDMTFNAIRLFDEIDSEEITQTIRSAIKLEDVHREFISDEVNDTIQLRDEVKITTYDI